MVLIVTQRGDLTADWLIRELEDRQAPFVRFNTEDYPTKVGLVHKPYETVLTLADREVSTGDVQAVWYRRPVLPRMPQGLPAETAMWARREAAEALLGVWRTLDAMWVNHPDRNRMAESKPEQLRTASAMGFDVPPSLITNEGSVLRQFLDDHDGEVICKPLWSGRVTKNGEDHLFFTSVVGADVDTRAVGPEPYLFQHRVDKRYDIRVTVIDNEAFAARIDSQDDKDARTDWRRGEPGLLGHTIERLPSDIGQLCVGLCQHYGLRFGAIDLARRDDGGYTFFEINPNGQWAWVEQRTGLPLRARLADLLLAPCRRG